jgi:hypothetical protein
MASSVRRSRSKRLDHGEDTLDEVHEINVTPFIDVMLVLLIIFMVAAPLATVDIQVNLSWAAATAFERQGAGHGADVGEIPTVGQRGLCRCGRGEGEQSGVVRRLARPLLALIHGSGPDLLSAFILKSVAQRHVPCKRQRLCLYPSHRGTHFQPREGKRSPYAYLCELGVSARRERPVRLR